MIRFKLGSFEVSSFFIFWEEERNDQIWVSSRLLHSSFPQTTSIFSHTLSNSSSCHHFLLTPVCYPSLKITSWYWIIRISEDVGVQQALVSKNGCVCVLVSWDPFDFMLFFVFFSSMDQRDVFPNETCSYPETQSSLQDRLKIKQEEKKTYFAQWASFQVIDSNQWDEQFSKLFKCQPPLGYQDHDRRPLEISTGTYQWKKK